MGTRSLVSAVQSKTTADRRLGFGQLDVKKEFRIKKETPDDEIKEYAETAMNELLGWYGYDKVDSRDTQGLNLHHFAANKLTPTGRSPSDAESSDAEGTKTVGSPPRRDVPSRESPSLPEQGAGAAGCIVCSWCNKVVSHKMFSLKTPGGEKSFCSEMCFSQCRRANFKRNKTCDWCRHIRHTVNYVDFQDGEHQLQFCSDKCLNQYKMNIFCKETEAHLQLHPHLQGLGSSGGGTNGSASVRLITPELWLRDCRSESPFSDRSSSPPENSSSSIEVKVLMRPPGETPQLSSKPPPPSLEITKVDKRDKSRKNNSLTKPKRQIRCFPPPGDRRGSSSSPRSSDALTPPKPLFPPPLLPLNQHPNLPTDPTLPLRPPFLPLPCFPPSHILPPNHPLHRNLHPYDHILRPPLVSPTSPPVPTPPQPPPPPPSSSSSTTTGPTPNPTNPPTRPNPPPPPPPPPPLTSLLPPVTILVPYPIALAIPIPLPIPIPIPLPLLPSRSPKSPKPPSHQQSPLTINPSPSPSPSPSPPPPPTPPLPPPSSSPTTAPQPPSIPRPLRKRKRLTELPHDDDPVNKRKTVPV